MKTIEQLANKYEIVPDCEQRLAFIFGVKTAQRWIPVEEKLPACFESGEWNGARSEFVLVKHSDSSWRKARLYYGILDGQKYNDWYDENDYELGNITHWRPVELK